MNGSDRSEYWRGLVLEQASSGESIASFCRVRCWTEASFGKVGELKILRVERRGCVAPSFALLAKI